MTIFNMKIVIFTDGGSRGNPGPAAIGVVICDEQKKPIKKYSQAIEETTNNEAEYQALIFALKKVKALYGKEETKQMALEIRMDSELIAKQLNHEYKIMETNLQPLFLRVWNLMLDFGNIKFVAIPREQNKEADRLVNQALDAKQESLL
jgi:ribonuclease HI